MIDSEKLREVILEKLSTVIDPETGVDVVRMRLIEDLVLARQTDVPTPAIDRLYTFFDLETPRMPEGSAEIPLDWRDVYLGLGALIGILGLAGLMFKLLKPKRK